MIEITYTHDKIFGEPGPNMLFSGPPSDFLLLANNIHILGTTDAVSINASKLNFIQTRYEVNFESKRHGKVLTKTDGNKMSIRLDKKYWPEFIGYLISVSYLPSHNYIDFDGVALDEDTNIILKSI